MMNRCIILSVGICLFLSTSCTISRNNDEDFDTFPDTVANNVRQVSVSADGRVEVTADRLEEFYEDDYRVLFNVKVREYNENREVRLTGQTDRIEYRGNGDGIAKGNIIIANLEDETMLGAESMNLDKDDRILVGEGSVSVDLGDGLTIESGKFTADLGKKTYTFSEGVNGILIVGEDENDADNVSPAPDKTAVTKSTILGQALNREDLSDSNSEDKTPEIVTGEPTL